MDFQSYENYFPTFQLFLLTVVKEFELVLKENGSTENEWNGLVWLPAPVQVQPHGPVAPVPADAAQAQPHGPAVPIQLQAVPAPHQPAPQPAGPAQVQPHGPAAPTAVVRPSVREDELELR